MSYYTFSCPHCHTTIQVQENQLNCKIFRCGVHKNSNQQINPHLPKKECDILKEKGLIYGCGRPFKFNGKDVEICDYI